MLGEDRRCGTYVTRPGVCHLYPYQVHAGRRVQVAISLGCPGVASADGAEGDREDMSVGAQEAARLAQAQPGAAAMALRAKDAFVEFDRRMKEWGVEETPDRLRAGFLPHVVSFARPALLPRVFTGLAPGELVLAPKPERAVEALFEGDSEVELQELLEHAALEGFDEPETVLWVEASHEWTSVSVEGRKVTLTREKGADRRVATFDVHELPVDWSDEASAVLAEYLARLCHRDQTEGAAAWVVDASGYQATPASAFGRVLAEASLHVVLRAGLLAAESGSSSIDADLARRGVAAYETSYHSLPTLGCIL